MPNQRLSNIIYSTDNNNNEYGFNLPYDLVEKEALGRWYCSDGRAVVDTMASKRKSELLEAS